jgi:hypothetical protein
MHRSALYVLAAILALSSSVGAASIGFVTDPFAGSDALTTPGRQVVGGEPFITFDIANDTFFFDLATFGMSEFQFANDLVENLPTSGVNTIVLQTAPTPFNAGLAANAIADQITTPGPGLFIYFNSGLDLPRLVFSTDLSDNTADLKVLARLTNLAGNRAALSTFTSANFAPIPEPSSLMLISVAAAVFGCGAVVRGKRIRS